MKTNYVQFKKLSKRQRRQFIKNLRRGETTTKLFGESEETIFDALHCAFIWNYAPEGHSYWYNISKKFEND